MFLRVLLQAFLTCLFIRRTAVVHLTQNISPSIFPSFIKLQVPAITTLHFRETDEDMEEDDTGLLKIYRQEDSWTLDGMLYRMPIYTGDRAIHLIIGLIQSMPLISFWYNQILRVVMGKLVTATGDLLDAALRHAHKMSMRGREIQRRSQDLARENLEKLEEYRANLHENYLEGIRGWRENYVRQDRLLALNEYDNYIQEPLREIPEHPVY